MCRIVLMPSQHLLLGSRSVLHNMHRCMDLLRVLSPFPKASRTCEGCALADFGTAKMMR